MAADHVHTYTFVKPQRAFQLQRLHRNERIARFVMRHFLLKFVQQTDKGGFDTIPIVVVVVTSGGHLKTTFLFL